MELFDINKFQKVLVGGLPDIFTKYKDVTLNNVRGEVRRRIFNRGEDVDGNKIGTYSPASQLIKEQKKQAKGIYPNVSLQDTKTLRDNVIRGKSGGEDVFGIVEVSYKNENKTTGDVARENQDRFGKTIFEISDKTLAKASKGATKAISKELDDLIKKALV